MSTQAAIPSLAAACAALLLAACGGGGGATASNPDPPMGEGAPPASSQETPPSEEMPPSEGRLPSPSPPRTDTATEQRARSTGIVSRANSLIASPWSVQRGSAAVTNYQPSCTETTCTFTSPTAGLIPPPPQRLDANLHLARPGINTESLGTQHHITLIQSSWSSADKKTPHPSEELNFVMFGAWMDHSVFFTSLTGGQFFRNAYNQNVSIAAGHLSGSPPPGTATWQGLMVGSFLTGVGRGDRLQGDASLTYSLTSQVLDAAFTNIRNLDTETAHSVPRRAVHPRSGG